MRLTAFIFFVLGSCPVWAQDTTAQQDSVAMPAVDSTELRIAEYQKLLDENLQRSKEDSIKKQQLLEQINLLHARDEKKQAAVLSQIRDIEYKDSVRNAERKNKVLELKRTSKGFPVDPFEDTLFMVYLKIGPILPAERAASTSKKIQLLYDNPDFKPDSVQVVTTEFTTDVVYGDMIIMSVTEWDALWWDVPKTELADTYRDQIAQAIAMEVEANSLKNLLLRFGLAFLIALLAIVLVLALNVLFRRIDDWIIQRKDVFLKGVKIRDYEIFPPDRELQMVLGFFDILKWVIFIVVSYLALPLIFSLFPFTKGWAETLFGWVWTPTKDVLLAIWHYLPNLFSIAVIYIITRYSIKLFKFLSEEIR